MRGLEVATWLKHRKGKYMNEESLMMVITNYAIENANLRIVVEELNAKIEQLEKENDDELQINE